MNTEGLRTAAALRYAGLERPFWNSCVTRQIHTDLPPATPGKAGRFFAVDDLVALDVFGELIRIGVMLHVAGVVASKLRASLRADGRAKKLYLVTVADADGTTRPEIAPEPPPDSKTLWIIDVAKARRMARAAIAEHRA